jgi:uncharacterized membrane protein YcaP (DUF421 family)
VTIAFGSVLASVMTSRSVSLVQGVVALGLLIVLQFISTFLAVRLRWYQSLIKAQPTLLYFRGEYLSDALRRQRVTTEEVLAAVRQHGIMEMGELAAVVLETEGSLAVLQGKGDSSPDALARIGLGPGEP